MCSLPNRCEWLLTHRMCALEGWPPANHLTPSQTLRVCEASEPIRQKIDLFRFGWLSTERHPFEKTQISDTKKINCCFDSTVCVVAVVWLRTSFVYFCRFYYRRFVFRLCARTRNPVGLCVHFLFSYFGIPSTDNTQPICG